MTWGFDGAHGTDVRPAHRNATKRWAKDESAPGVNDGTRLTASVVNRLIGNIARLLARGGVSETASSDDDLADGVVALIESTAPASHTHAVAAVEGLEDALAAKAAASHTHTVATLTDGSGYVRMTDAERTKLSALPDNFRGYHADLAALEAAHAAAATGAWAILANSGASSVALWDGNKSPSAGWIDTGAATVGGVTTFNARSGAVSLSSGDVTTALTFTPANAARTLTAAGLVTGGGDLSADRTLTVTAATQAEAEAGTATSVAMTPQRTKQAIDALAPGRLVARAYAETAASSNLTAIIPLDDTVPASGEGTQVLSITHTLAAAGNRVRLALTGQGAVSEPGAGVVWALFRGSVCVAAGHGLPEAASNSIAIAAVVEDAPGATGPHTYSVRIGPGSAATVRLNGRFNARLLGGAARTTLVLEEIKP